MIKTILVLAANPKNTPRLRLDQEVREIDDGLERAQKRDEFTLKQKWAARPVDVRRAMLDYKPYIVHFCGHGSGKEGIAFEDENGQYKLVDTDAIAGLFALFADKVVCVVLNACYSEVQAEAIAKHIPYVIGMKKAIGDTAARVFAVAFYDALGAGEPVEFAYKLACNAIQWLGMPESSTPVLRSTLRLDQTLLEPIQPSEGFGAIVNMEALKKWLTQRRWCFEPGSLSSGFKPPKGVLVFALPGCGRGAIVRATAVEWKVPLYRLNLNSFVRLHREWSAQRISEALKQAETAAPCILWLDEFGHLLTASRDDPSTLGIYRDMLHATLIIWIQEKNNLVFVFATATDFEQLPPEYLRLGRFDKCFFIDLPSPEERLELLTHFLENHKQKWVDLDLASHVAKTEGFSGAEMEQVIVDAVHEVFSECNDIVVRDHHIEKAITSITPLSSTIHGIQRWRERAREKLCNASGRERDSRRLKPYG